MTRPTNKTPTSSEVFETVWPDKSFARFGGHVLERLQNVHGEIAAIRDRRFRVRVTVEVDPMPEETPDDERQSALDQTRR